MATVAGHIVTGHPNILNVMDGLAGQPGDVNYAMNSTSDNVQISCAVPRTGSITDILFAMNTVTTGDTLKVELQDVGTNGLGDGTPYGSSASGTLVVAAGDDDKVLVAPLGTAASTATEGDMCVVKITFNSWVAGNMNIGGINGALDYRSMPSIELNGSIQRDIPMVTFKYSDGKYFTPQGCFPPGHANSIPWDTPDEKGIVITLPFAATLTGVSMWGRPTGTTQGIELNLYDDSATPVSLATTFTELTHDMLQNAVDGVAYVPITYSLVADTTYYLGLCPLTANNYEMFRHNLGSEGLFHWDDGTNTTTQTGSYATRTRTTGSNPDGGPAFTVSATQTLKPIWKIHLKDIDVGGAAAASGGGARVIQI
jgi:hypothetical protein